ncbi:hypothetical protein GQ53DRAFT_63748 [Thozetella sp. PMI_491]|nr:hypothetical protein GQ53DRAFT_63748 [Thozetella sp. PMI_491]
MSRDALFFLPYALSSWILLTRTRKHRPHLFLTVSRRLGFLLRYDVNRSGLQKWESCAEGRKKEGRGGEQKRGEKEGREILGDRGNHPLASTRYIHRHTHWHAEPYTPFVCFRYLGFLTDRYPLRPADLGRGPATPHSRFCLLARAKEDEEDEDLVPLTRFRS